MDSQYNFEEFLKILKNLEKLAIKYENLDQPLSDYLAGLLESNYTNYWDYIQLDSLLGLLKPKTNYPDEKVFIRMHHVFEIYFERIKDEILLLINGGYNDLGNWFKTLDRVNAYFRGLEVHFSILIDGMDTQEFGKFRMALQPASGFQSVQFREIEILSTSLPNLLPTDERKDRGPTLRQVYEKIYWKSGGIELQSGKKTLTLSNFEEKYDDHLISMIKQYRFKNLAYLYSGLPLEMRKNTDLIIKIREYDSNINIIWKLQHLKAVGKHLSRISKGTGGTNFKKYLPPKFQKIQFFPRLWSEAEKANWGAKFVTET